MDTTEQDVELFRDYMADPAARAAFVEFKAKAASDGTARRYEHVLLAVGSRPWAIHEPMLGVIVDILTFRAYGGRLTAEEIEGRVGPARRTPTTEAPRGVARIPVSGVIMPKAGGFEKMSGGTSAESLGASIQAATRSAEVSSIVLDMDSPGGAVDGIPELADIIAQANTVKPVTAVANHEALSAAYWLASQADRIVASPSGRVGSIGVITRHQDESVKEESRGVKTTLVSAGKFKAEGSPFAPLTEEAQAHLQAMVDEFYGMFVGAVARGRGVSAEAVRTGFGEGRVVTASAGLKLGLIDSIDTIDSVIAQELRRDTSARVVAVGAPLAVVVTGPSVALETGSATTAANGFEARLGDGTSHDDEIERLRVALNSDPDEEPETPAEPEPIQAVVDNSAWDGNKAMTECNSAADYRSICAGEHTVGTPDQRQHWALPHHYLGKGPNAPGVRQAESRISQTQNLANRAAAQAHLDAHMKEIRGAGADAEPSEVEALEEELLGLDRDPTVDPEIANLKEELEILGLSLAE